MGWEKLPAEAPTSPAGRQVPRVDAEVELRAMVAAGSPPTLDQDEVDLLLDRARQVDSWGRHWDDDSWIETYDLNLAAQLGWEWKAGKAAGSFDLNVDSQQMSRSQIAQSCREQAAMYRSRRTATMPRPASLPARRR